MMGRSRIALFVAILAAALGVAGVYLAVAMRRSASTAVERGEHAFVPPRAGEPFLLFRWTARQPAYGALAYVDVERRDPIRVVPGLQCRRVHMAGGRGVCLASRGGTAFVARIFDADFRVTAEVPLAGVPSRTQVAPDGRLAAATVFVSGHSYADSGFSTQTSILDLEAGTPLVDDLETFTVRQDGKVVTSVDYNFWGVTFLRDGRTFFATLGTRGQTYLVKGSVDTRSMDILESGIECPSISPDNTAIAYKHRVAEGFGGVRWQVWLMDLATRRRRPLAETNPVDDQVQWLDDRRLVYGRASVQDEAATDLWVMDREGSAAPSLYLAHAWSGTVVRP